MSAHKTRPVRALWKVMQAALSFSRVSGELSAEVFCWWIFLRHCSPAFLLPVAKQVVVEIP